MTTKRPVKKAGDFDYSKPLTKKAVTPSTPTLKEALAKIGVATSLKKVK